MYFSEQRLFVQTYSLTNVTQDTSWTLSYSWNILVVLLDGAGNPDADTVQSDRGAGHTGRWEAHVLETQMDEVTITASFCVSENTLHCRRQIWWILLVIGIISTYMGKIWLMWTRILWLYRIFCWIWWSSGTEANINQIYNHPITEQEHKQS